MSRCNYIKHLFNHVHAKVFGFVQGYKFLKLETSKQNDLLLLNELTFFRSQFLRIVKYSTGWYPFLRLEFSRQVFD